MANAIMGRRAIYTFDQIIGQSDQIKTVIQFGDEISDSKSTVLLTGESGTGKEIFAHAIHNNSKRRNKNFIVVNCASIPRSLIESELLATKKVPLREPKGVAILVNLKLQMGGLFLDEIGEMPLDMQTRLLRVIQEGMVSRVGSNSQFPIDVRIIAATNKDLYEEVNKGNFRLDLYYRLKVLPLHLPPLRERPEDIPLLVDYFNQKVSASIHKSPMDIPEAYMAYLKAYDWPGNVRELENVIELMLNTRTMPDLSRGKVGAMGQGSGHENPSKALAYTSVMTLEALEKVHIERIIKEVDGNITQAAKCLGIGRNTLYRKIQQYNIS